MGTVCRTSTVSPAFGSRQRFGSEMRKQRRMKCYRVLMETLSDAEGGLALGHRRLSRRVFDPSGFSL